MNDVFKYKGYNVTECEDGYSVKGCVWFFGTFDLLKEYVAENNDIEPTETGAMRYGKRTT